MNIKSFLDSYTLALLYYNRLNKKNMDITEQLTSPKVQNFFVFYFQSPDINCLYRN